MARNILISLNQAIKLVQKEKKNFIRKEDIKLEKSMGRVSSKIITSPIDLPTYDSAGLDGYVIVNKNKKTLKISKKIITPGKLYTNLDTNLAYRINTGSIIPDKFSYFISTFKKFVTTTFCTWPFIIPFKTFRHINIKFVLI